MRSRQKNEIYQVEADSFVGMNLNETGKVNDFIQKLIEEIKVLDNLEKDEYLKQFFLK